MWDKEEFLQFLLGLGVPLLISIIYLFYRPQAAKTKIAEAVKPPAAAKKVDDKDECCNEKGESGDCCKQKTPKETRVPLRILYGSTTGHAEGFSRQLEKDVFALNVSNFHFDTSVVDMKAYDQDNLEQETVVVFLLSTWTDGVPPESAKTFFYWLKDLVLDFRVNRQMMMNVKFAIFGLGNSLYDENYCKAAITLQGYMEELGAEPFFALGKGDDQVDQQAHFNDWKTAMLPALCEQYALIAGVSTAAELNSAGCCSTGGKGNAGALKQTQSWEEQEPKEFLSQNEYRRRKRKAREEAEKQAERQARGSTSDLVDEDLINAQYLAEESEDSNDDTAVGDSAAELVVDLEDLGEVMKKGKAENEVTLRKLKGGKAGEMVTPMQRRALTKEGYKIIGTHSAVKLCRWTKHQLRGRGGCYKHTFYGITSYQCMEATPSLACANKCVFCWRHHKNPVGREWRWQTDQPEEILQQAMDLHYDMIKQCRGVPGVIEERWEEAFNIQHCALSLVGEPIMYPHINELCKGLHKEKISSFLVTNAQFPEQIESLDPVTQLYVSIDAATKDSLKAVDRPLFKDFWERFLGSLDELRKKGQRTVYRLTLVKEWNMEEVQEYIELIQRGKPDLIEIKAVTYSGKSDGSSLTIKNSPWHEDVREFSEAICAQVSEEYAMACEHKHSCCILIAKKDFLRPLKKENITYTVAGGGEEEGLVEGELRWHTWINYPRYHELIQRYYATDGKESFTAADYMAPTPRWAEYNAKEEGFSPAEIRFRRTKDGKIVERPYKPSGSGCG